jgi:hypothetical protein
MTLGLHTSPLVFVIVRRSWSMVRVSSGVYGGEICRYSEPNTGDSANDWIVRCGGGLIYSKLDINTLREDTTNGLTI